MTLFKEKYRNNSNRLSWWDYKGDGAYFVTICTKNREEYFGKIKNGIMGLNEMGLAAYKCWSMISDHFNNVDLDYFVVMPNHIHGILILKILLPNQHHPQRRGGINPAPTLGKGGVTGKHNPMGKGVLGEIVRWFKGRTTYEIRKNPDAAFYWQRNYHDRIIRDEQELNNKRRYILKNPEKWTRDRNHPDNF